MWKKEKKRDVYFDLKSLLDFENMRDFEKEFMRGLEFGPDKSSSLNLGAKKVDQDGS